MSIHPTTIAAQLRAALHDGDASTLAALFHPDVRFEPLGAAAPANGSAEALTWYRDRRDRGFRTVVEELFTYPAGVVLGLRLSHPEPAAEHPVLLYRLFRLKAGQVVQIRDFTDRAHALTSAEKPFSWAPQGHGAPSIRGNGQVSVSLNSPTRGGAAR